MTATTLTPLIILLTTEQATGVRDAAAAALKQLTGQDFVKGFTSVEDLERKYGKKG